MNRKKRRGFTLVEIVLVMTILGIISSLGFSKFGEMQKNIKEKADYIAAANLAAATNLAIESGSIQVSGETTLKALDLKNKKYINSVPKPQSDSTADFEINIDKEGNISVKVSTDNVNIYPK